MDPAETSSGSRDALVEDSASTLGPPPISLALDPFYTKYLSANGLPIVSSQVVPDKALFVARDIVIHMLSKRPDVRQKLIDNHVRVGVMGKNQVATDIPEHRLLNQECSEKDWNEATRGVAAMFGRPATSCAEENLLCYSRDRYAGQNILVHEFGHTIHDMALIELDRPFVERLNSAFHSALQNDLWSMTYAATNVNEYWASGTRHWFDAGGYSATANGIYNFVHTRSDLRNYDPALHELLSEVFPDDDWRPRTSHQ